MPQITISFPGSRNLTDEQMQNLMYDLQNHPVRKLTKEERDIYAGAAINAVRIMPAFRDAIALLNPYLDATCSTAYTDKFARVGVSYWFLHLLNPYQRGTVLLHEAMHVMNNQFARAEAMGLDPKTFNIAGDFEINTTLERAKGTDLAAGIFPDRAPFSYPKGMTMEQYAQLLAQDGKNKSDDITGPDSDSAPDPSSPGDGEEEKDDENESGDGSPSENSGDGDPNENSSKGSGGEGQESQDGDGEGSGSGDGDGEGSGQGQPGGSGNSAGVDHKDHDKNWGCSSATEKRSKAADGAGVDRSSSAEQSTVKSNTAARISEEATKARAAGDSHMEAFYKIVLDQITPPKVDWRQIFKRICGSANDAAIRGRSDYSYRRVSRRLSGGDYIFPGMVQYVPTAMLGIDISGSMTNDDYQKTLTEAEGIMKSSAKTKGGLRVFPVDTQVGKIKTVASVREVNLYGGGGTAMQVAADFVASLPTKERPDIFVLATDGGTDWDAYEQSILPIYRQVKCIVLVTSKYGWDIVPDSLKNLITMIDVSSEK